jgi:hypothetical protein
MYLSHLVGLWSAISTNRFTNILLTIRAKVFHCHALFMLNEFFYNWKYAECHMALVRTNISVECITSIIRKTRIGELGTLPGTKNRNMLRRNTSVLWARVVPSTPILVTLMMEAICSSKTSVLTRATQHNMAFFMVMV